MTGWALVAALAGPMRDGLNAFGMRAARGTGQRLLGFWVLWVVYGGRTGLLESQLMSDASVYRNAAEFKALFGVPVDEFAPEAAAALRLSSARADASEAEA